MQWWRLTADAPCFGPVDGESESEELRGEEIPTESEVPAGDEQMLTTGEAAALCGVSRSTLRRAVAQGQVRAWHTPGMHLRFSKSSCLEFARSLGRVDLVGQPYRRSLDQSSEVEVPVNGHATRPASSRLRRRSAGAH